MGVERYCDREHVHRQEMCTLCSAATPSPSTRVRLMKESEGA